MAKISSKLILMKAIRAYQLVFSRLFGHCCRFEPSCSNYAIESIHTFGCFHGCYLALRRLLRCHPWHPGGIDLVPQPKKLKRCRPTC